MNGEIKMRFDDFDKKMRIYEESLDQVILPDMYMVARLDGRGFTKLTKEICKFEAPFDIKFRDMMVETTKALMDCGFRVIYGFTESDEISLLFHSEDNTFGRKVRKYNSILAGVASATMTKLIGEMAIFDCRIIPLPNIDRVKDYFLWRQEDAHRNSLNSYCYWTLRKEGASVNTATNTLEGKSVSFKNELLFSKGINYDQLPSWQKRGVGIYRKVIQREGFNPITNEKVMTDRNIIAEDFEIPLGAEYSAFIERILTESEE